MMTAGDAVRATVGFFGRGAGGFESGRDAAVLDAQSEPGGSLRPDPDPLSRGEPMFEAVAEALRRRGYLDS